MDKMNLLIVDDEIKTLRLLQVNLEKSYKIFVADNGTKALKILESEPIDIILTDLKMPEMDGEDLFKYVKENKSKIPILIITAYGTIKNAVDMIKDGAFDYISKPIDIDALELSLSKASNYSNLIKENKILREQLNSSYGLQNIITVNKKMQEILKTVSQIANTNFTVLIEGETGTGKELVAKAIHSLSARTTKPFIAINCAAIPKELLESELFGFEKGAFTGAIEKFDGRFLQSNSGTLFLDEIGDMPLELQSKLLRAIEERKITKIGGTKSIPIDVRIIASTNKNLRDEINKNNFREDLYYRLNVVNIFLPPLRERVDDIPILANHFLIKHKDNIKNTIKGLEPNVIEYLKSYNWKGNVRELENVIIRSMVKTKNEFITVNDLPEEISLSISSEIIIDDLIEENVPDNYQSFLELKNKIKEQSWNELEKKFILENLRKNNWNISLTARNIGIDRRYFQNLMKKHNIQ
ncbi:MAG: sigma-54 dependent transcriptional regulator [Ignavibacterium sp.]